MNFVAELSYNDVTTRQGHFLAGECYIRHDLTNEESNTIYPEPSLNLQKTSITMLGYLYLCLQVY